jgi:hypothetical protein
MPSAEEQTMPALTITAVDGATDQLTIVGHGLNTGDGPAAVRSIGGTTAGGLAPVTDYWAIRIDADHIKLATSNTNANAGAAIDITSNGSGVQLLLLGLPYRRPRTYAEKSQLKSPDLNALFDDDVALYNLLTGQPQSVYDGVTIVRPFAVAGTISPPVIDQSMGGGVIHDYAPAGINTANTIRQAVTDVPSIGGIVGGADGRILVLHVIGATLNDKLGLGHEAIGSTPANRILCPGIAGGGITVPHNGAVILQYDGISQRWRIASKNF